MAAGHLDADFPWPPAQLSGTLFVIPFGVRDDRRDGSARGAQAMSFETTDDEILKDFAAFYQTYLEPVQGALRSWLRVPQQDVDDLAQAFFTKVLETLWKLRKRWSGWSRAR